MSEELDRLAHVMRRFADEELQGSSPLYERLARAIADEPQLLAPLLEAPPTQRRATLYFAAIHHLLLQGAGQDFARFYPDITSKPETGDPVPGLRRFLADHADDLVKLYSTRNTQTNEVGRCAFLLPMFARVAARAGRPLAMIEAGASAGLNLLFDRYFYDYGAAGSVGDPASPVRLAPEIRGAVQPPVPQDFPAVASRVGIDLEPVNVNDDDAVAWLRACIWPEHAARVELFTNAVEIARGDPPKVVRGDFVSLLPEMLEGTSADSPVCVFHTAALAYLPRAERARFGELLDEAGREREIYWLAGEGPHILESLFPDAGITGPEGGYALVTDRAGHRAHWVGEAGYHGRWLRWRS